MSWTWRGTLALAAATAAGYLGTQHWLLELAAHFRPHLVALSFVWMFLALFRHRPLAVTLCAALMALNAVPAVPYLMNAGTPHAAHSGTDGESVRLMSFNLHGRGSDRRALLDYIQAEQPDIILLTELPAESDWLFAGLGADYPHQLDDQGGGAFNVVVLSRWPVAGWRSDRGADRTLPVLSADLCPSADADVDRCFRVIGLHAARPFGAAVAKQNAQLAIAAAMAREAPQGRAVILGDLNLTPWAPRFKELLAAAGMRDAALGRGLTATWLSRQPILGLAIDHILATPNLAVADFRVGPDLGSDHLPVIADLARHP